LAYIYDDSQTYTGEIVNFTSTDKANITSVSVPLTYSQDLHGYDHPWPAGEGINKLSPATVFTHTSNGITLKSYGDGRYTLSGTATASFEYLFDIPEITMPGTVYIHLLNSAGGSANAAINIDFYNGSTRVDFLGFGTTANRKYNGTSALGGKVINKLKIRVSNGEAISGELSFSPMALLANDTVDFSPYSNICPITGLTGLSVYVSPTQDPDDATIYNVDWSTQAGTVYGGTVDVVTGVLTVNKAYKAFDGTEDWGLVNSAYFITVVRPLNSVVNDSAISTHYLDNPTISGGNYQLGFRCYNRSSSPYTGAVVLVRPEAPLTSSLADFKAWLSSQNTNGTPFAVCYELATPQTYQLTPKQITALLGQNYVWVSNGASITVVVSDVLHDFQGWLLKVGSGMTLVPTTMIKAETYKVSPNQRMEETAERDSTGVLWRETVPNMPPKIEFNTPAAYDTDVNALNAIFRAAYSNEQERKLTVAFYDPEENVYKSWECYMPNIDFPIRTIDIDAKTIFYDEIRYAFIGY